MYLLLEHLHSRSLRGSVPLYGLEDGTADFPHHIILATPQAIHVVPITYKAQTEVKPQLQFARQKVFKINDAIERVWSFRPPPLPYKDNWRFQKSPHEIEVALPSMLYVIERKRHSEVRIATDTPPKFHEGFLLLTARHEFCVYAIDPTTVSPVLVSKLDLMQPQLRRHPSMPQLTIDPTYSIALLYIYEGQFEYICLNPAFPFALSSSMPFRTVESEIRAIQFLRGAESPVQSAKRRFPADISSKPLKVARRANAKAAMDTLTNPPVVQTVPTLAILYNNLPDQAVEIRLQNLAVCETTPLRLRVVEFGTSNVLSTEDMAGPPPLELGIHAASGALIEVQSESAIAVVGGREVQLIQWQRRQWGAGAHCELDVRLAEVEVWQDIGDGRWLIGDAEGTLLGVSFGGPDRIQSKKLGRLTPAMDFVPIMPDTVWLGAYLGSSYLLKLKKEFLSEPATIIDDLDNLAPILDFVREPFTVVAGGWMNQGGLRIIQHGVKATALAQIQDPLPYSHIHELNVKARDQIIVGLLTRPLGPSALLVCKSSNPQTEQLSVDVRIVHEAILPGLDLVTPTISLLKTSTHFWQLTQTELRQMDSTDVQLIKANAVPELGHVVGATPGTNDDLWIAGNVSGDLAVVLQVTSDFVSNTVHRIPYAVRSLCAGSMFVAVGSACEPFVELFAIDQPGLSRGRTSLVAAPTKTLLYGRRETDPPNPIAVALCSPRSAIADATTEVLLISSSSGELLSLDVPRTNASTEGIRPIKRTLGSVAGEFATVSPHQVMALGALPVLVSCDLSGVPSWRPADLPEGVSSLCVMDWPELAGAAAARATEVPIWYLDGSRRLGLGLLDREPQGCESAKTVFGFCVEHLARDPDSGVFIAAGLELTPIREKLDASAAPSWNARKLTQEDTTTGVGAVVLLRADNRSDMVIEQAVKFENCEVPTALKVVTLNGAHLVAVGTTFEPTTALPVRGGIRILEIARETDTYMGNDDNSTGQSTHDVPPAACKLKILAEKEFRGSIQSVCSVQDLLMVASHNRVIGLRLREASAENPKPLLVQVSSHVMYNYIVDMVPFGPNHLLVGDSQRSCGLVHVNVGRGGIVQVTEVAHDFNGVPVLSVAQMDDSTIVLSDDQKHLWVLKCSPNKDSITHCGRIRVNEQVNRMQSGKLAPTRLHSDRQSCNGVFSLFKDTLSLPIVNWASCEGAMGMLVPITNTETYKHLELLIKIISQKAAAQDGLDPVRGRSVLLGGREMPSRAIIDGKLISWALRQSIDWQRSLHEAFVEQSVLLLAAATQPLSFDEFRSQLEQLDLLT